MANKIARAAIHASAQTSFHPAQANENSRDGWDKGKYNKKNEDTSHHYDITRKNLNFLVTSDGIKPLSSTNANLLYNRYLDRLSELGFKAYDPDAPNQPNSYIDWVFSGDHEVMTRMAFGSQNVDFELKHSNAHVRRMPQIKNFAMDVYRFACKRFGAENVLGVECHLDETTPHIHINMIPVALRQQRGRASHLYREKDDPTKTITSKEYRNLSKEARAQWVKSEAVDREQKLCVSFSGLVGSSRAARGKWLHQFHTDFHNEVGRHYGLERGREKDTLTEEELMNYGHKTAAELEAERIAQIKEAQQLDNDIASRRAELHNIQRLTKEANNQLKAKNIEVDQIKTELKTITEEADKAKNELEHSQDLFDIHKTGYEKKLASLKTFVNASEIKKEDLKYKHLNISHAENTFLEHILKELATPIGTFQSAKNWSEQRSQNIKKLFGEFKTNVQSSVNDTNEDLNKSINRIYSYYMQQLAKAKNAAEADEKNIQAKTLYALMKGLQRDDLSNHIANGTDATTIGKILRNIYKQQSTSVADYMYTVTNRHKSPNEIIQLSRDWNHWKSQNQDFFDAEGKFVKALREAAWCLEDKVYVNKDGLLEAFNKVVNTANRNSASHLVWGKTEAENIATGIELIAAPQFNNVQTKTARSVMMKVINQSEVVADENKRQQQENNIFTSDLFRTSVNTIITRTSDSTAHSFSLEQTALIATTLGLFADDHREMAAKKMVNMAKAEATCNSGWFNETEEEMTNIVANIGGLLTLLAMPPQGPAISAGGGGGSDLPWRDRDDDWWERWEHALNAKPKYKPKR